MKLKRRAALPVAKHEATALPESHQDRYEPFRIDTPGSWLVLSDIHVPYHDRTTLELAAKEAKRRGVVGVLLNGDTLDYHDLSDHDKDAGAPRYVDEIQAGRQLLVWLRESFPKARIVMKEGNHEERLPRYVMRNAPALAGIAGLDTPSLLGLADVGAEWVGDKRVIQVGKLCVLHGHEYRGGGGVNPARWIFTKARYVSMVGHFHRTSEHGGRNVLNTEERAWSVGCACYLYPKWLRLNEWNNGCAFVELARDGGFRVDNKRVFKGELV